MSARKRAIPGGRFNVAKAGYKPGKTQSKPKKEEGKRK